MAKRRSGRNARSSPAACAARPRPTGVVRGDEDGFRRDYVEEENDDSGEEITEEDDSLWEGEAEFDDLDDSAAA